MKWPLVCCAVSVLLAGCDYIARKTLTTGPNGSETPAAVGLDYQRVSISSGAGHLDAYLVPAPANCGNAPAILIFHGVQETISMWVGAQRLLSAHCVHSLVFDYTGSGDSSRPASMRAVTEDGAAAYEYARGRFPYSRLFTLGHSMGNGILLDALPHFSRPPDGVIVANAFSSMRNFAGRTNVFYGLLSHLVPDWWDNVRTVRAVRVPILVLSSDADRVVPADDGQRIFAQANEPKRFVLLHGYPHNALYRAPDTGWWAEPLSFIGASTGTSVTDRH